MPRCSSSLKCNVAEGGVCEAWSYDEPNTQSRRRSRNCRDKMIREEISVSDQIMSEENLLMEYYFFVKNIMLKKIATVHILYNID